MQFIRFVTSIVIPADEIIAQIYEMSVAAHEFSMNTMHEVSLELEVPARSVWVAHLHIMI